MLKIGSLLESYGSVPSMPRVLAQLLVELERPAPDLARVKRFVAADPGLTCRVLQLAYASRPDASPVCAFDAGHAVEQVGLAHLRVLCRAVSAAASFAVVPGIDMRQFWRVSVNAAKVSRSLATLIKIDPVSAFTAGMIHSVGQVFMQLGMPEEMAILNKRMPPFRFGRAKAEEHVVGYSYATVAAEFARKWHFPELVVLALRQFPVPYTQGDYEPLVGVLHLGVWRARAFEAGFTPARYAAEFPYEVALALNLDIDTVLKQSPVDWHSTGGGAADTQAGSDTRVVTTRRSVRRSIRATMPLAWARSNGGGAKPAVSVTAATWAP